MKYFPHWRGEVAIVLEVLWDCRKVSGGLSPVRAEVVEMRSVRSSSSQKWRPTRGAHGLLAHGIGEANRPCSERVNVGTFDKRATIAPQSWSEVIYHDEQDIHAIAPCSTSLEPRGKRQEKEKEIAQSSLAGHLRSCCQTKDKGLGLASASWGAHEIWLWIEFSRSLTVAWQQVWLTKLLNHPCWYRLPNDSWCLSSVYLFNNISNC